jgi:hypothetical protein
MHFDPRNATTWGVYEDDYDRVPTHEQVVAEYVLRESNDALTDLLNAGGTDVVSARAEFSRARVAGLRARKPFQSQVYSAHATLLQIEERTLTPAPPPPPPEDTSADNAVEASADNTVETSVDDDAVKASVDDDAVEASVDNAIEASADDHDDTVSVDDEAADAECAAFLVKMVNWASAAYLSPSQFPASFPSIPHRAYIDVGTDSHAYVIEDAEDVVVTIRGNDSLRDVIFDVHIQSAHVEESAQVGGLGRVHAGFHRQAVALKDLMMPNLTRLLRSPGRKLRVTGHSGGAAIGGILAVILKRAFPSTYISYVGFGGPGYAKRDFSTSFQALMDYAISFRNSNDPVGMAFHRLFEEPTVQVRLGDRSRWTTRLERFQLYYLLDHPVARYVAAIDQYVKNGGGRDARDV